MFSVHQIFKVEPTGSQKELEPPPLQCLVKMHKLLGLLKQNVPFLVQCTNQNVFGTNTASVILKGKIEGAF